MNLFEELKFIFHTLGCKLNFAESSALGKVLLEQGYTKASRGEKADVCILNTCSVTDAADHKGRQAIRMLRRQHPNAVLIVTGCYAQLHSDDIARMPEVDMVLGQNEKFAISKIIPRLTDLIAQKQHDASANNEAAIFTSDIRRQKAFHPSYSKDDRTRCFLKIQDGCDYFCTYCTIPYARGRSRNADIEKTVLQAQKAIEEGQKEIVLTGVNIGDFGKSTGETFIDLLRRLDTLDGEVRFRISSCEPNLLTDEIIDFVAHSRHFTPHFHIPLQSGSNEMLQIMHRRYTRELFAERVERIKSLMPDAFIGVDCMVGVRGETEEYFNDYYKFVEQLPVSFLHVFTYSEREGTRMLRMNLEPVDQKERKRRSEIMHRLSENKHQAFCLSQKGHHATVLWEAKREGNLMSGFTENYVRVHRAYDPQRINTFEQIII